MKSYIPPVGSAGRRWWVVDADEQILGRLASRVAMVLRGKHTPLYTPHLDTGDFVVVVNAEKVRLTGRKETDKKYFRHSGHMGGERFVSFATMIEKHPERVIELAVKGMLPKNKLASQQISKLKIYAGPEHPHEAQAPKPLELGGVGSTEPPESGAPALPASERKQ